MAVATRPAPAIAICSARPNGANTLLKQVFARWLNLTMLAPMGGQLLGVLRDPDDGWNALGRAGQQRLKPRHAEVGPLLDSPHVA